jgi:hypothetical protein
LALLGAPHNSGKNAVIVCNEKEKSTEAVAVIGGQAGG